MVPRLLLALLMLVAACGDTAAPEAAPSPTVSDAAVVPEPAGEDALETPPATTADRPATTSAPPATTSAPAATTAFDGPPAPDFALPLENRDGTFVLSEAATPVYLTFWAEW